MTLPGLVRANNLNDVVDRERAWDNLGSSLATGDVPIPAPSLDLNFAANKSLVDDISGNNLITFSRASTGTFVGSNGLIQTAASGVPRFDHNPVTGESLGLLVEEARTNLLTYSEQFNDVVWTKNFSSISTNATTAPDGTLTADKFINDSSNSEHYITGPGVTFAPLTTGTTFSCFAKAAEFSKVAIGYINTFVVFDLANGTVFSTFNAFGFSLASSIQSFPGGWYRCSIAVNTNGTPFNPNLTIWMADASGNRSYAGDGISGIFLWGAQRELDFFPTSYIPTVASTVTRAADLVKITGTNFSSWYNNAQGTFYGEWRHSSLRKSFATMIIGTDGNGNNKLLSSDYATFISPSLDRRKGALGLTDFRFGNDSNYSQYINGSPGGFGPGLNALVGDGYPFAISIGYQEGQPASYLNSSVARVTYWPTRLYNQALQYITQSSITAINLYAFNYVINGKDVLALNAVRNASTRDFIFIKGLLSAAQPRLTAAAATTSSGLTLVANALPKLAPSSNGNYFFASGLTLSGVTTRINGTNALSIATSPFSGPTATAPLLFSELRPQANWRITEPMPSGTIASPEFAIPFETNNFVLFMKAGQN